MKPISISGSHIERVDGSVTATWQAFDPVWGQVSYATSVHELKDHAMQPCKAGCNPLRCSSDEHLVRTTALIRVAIPLEDVPCNLELLKEQTTT